MLYPFFTMRTFNFLFGPQPFQSIKSCISSFNKPCYSSNKNLATYSAISDHLSYCKNLHVLGLELLAAAESEGKLSEDK